MTNNSSQQAAFEHLLNISIQLSKEENTDLLMEKILLAAVEVSNSDAGSIFGQWLKRIRVSHHIQ